MPVEDQGYYEAMRATKGPTMTTDNPASPQREIAPGVEITDAMVSRACGAYEGTLFHETGEDEIAHMGAMRAALTVAIASSADVWRERCELAQRGIEHRGDDVVVPLALWEEVNRVGYEWKQKAEAAQALPGKWREESQSIYQSGDERGVYKLCADELEQAFAALGQRAAMGGEK